MKTKEDTKKKKRKIKYNEKGKKEQTD